MINTVTYIKLKMFNKNILISFIIFFILLFRINKLFFLFYLFKLFFVFYISIFYFILINLYLFI